MPPPIATLVRGHGYSDRDVERFLRCVPRRPVGKDRCWEWEGVRNNGGYGLFGRLQNPLPLLVRIIGTSRTVEVKRSRPTPETAHRVAYKLWRGPIPFGMVICHRCDNRGCVRPDHLVVGTQADNSMDMAAKHRHPTIGKLNPRKVRTIRRLWADGRLLQREIAARYGVSQVMVCRIVNGKVWTHVK